MQQAVAKLPDNHLLWKVPWGHHALLMEKIKDQSIRIWYMEQTIQNGWSRDVLRLMIMRNAHHRQGKLVSNFEGTLPKTQSDLATQSLKDPYIFEEKKWDRPGKDPNGKNELYFCFNYFFHFGIICSKKNKRRLKQMKTKKLERKLILNKKTISNLQDDEMSRLKGGETLRTECWTKCAVAEISWCYPCYTEELTFCPPC